MTVKELIEALKGQSQNAEVFYLAGDEEGGMYQVNAVKAATAKSDEVKEIAGKAFVVLS